MNRKGNILVAVAPNGARKTKSDHPMIPLSSAETAQTANDCMTVGASMIHLHVRNPDDNSHSLSAELYQKAIDAIDSSCQQQMFVQVTSEAVGIYTPDEQFEMIHLLKPGAVSIGLREIKSLDENVIHEHFIKMKAANIHPQIILYNEYDLNNYHDWLARKVLPGNTYPILLVIGKPTPEGSFENSYLNDENVKNLQASSWMICAFGENEFSAAKLAASLGGHIRIGFENNSVLADGSEAEDNASLINQIAQHLKNNNLHSANFAEAADIMRPDW
ncbi:MAG: 3-keto-5-aminohexanoate cleavage protein [Cocleimonas sp.]